MALPKTSRRASTSSRATITTSDSISEKVSLKIQNELLRSLAKTPNQTASFRSAETNRIANKFGVKVMSVAGVRANLTRGAYGNYKKLLREAVAAMGSK